MRFAALLVLLPLLLVASSGCNRSPADRAADELVVALSEIRAAQRAPVGQQGGPSIEELKKRYEVAFAKLDEEYEQLSPEEQKAFRDKWASQLRAAYQGMTMPTPW